MTRDRSVPGDDRDVRARADEAWLAALLGRVPPGVVASERAREPVLRAWRAAQGRPAAGPTSRPKLTRPRVRPPFVVVRALLVAAASAAIAVGGATAASAPGAPLYATRVAFERAQLPARGAAGRLAAEMDLADRRLDEAAAALDRGDRVALVAALDAYLEGVRDAALEGTAGVGESADVARRLDADASVLARISRSAAGDAEVDAAVNAAAAALRGLGGHRSEPSGRLDPRPGSGR
jgi:hypothetical protein